MINLPDDYDFRPMHYPDGRMTTTHTSGYAAVISICPRCGGGHALAQCPQVAAMEYYEDGRIKRVEYHAPPPARDPITTVTLLGGAPWEFSLEDVRRLLAAAAGGGR